MTKRGRMRCDNGRAAFEAYCENAGISQAERKQDYIIGDCIADLLHYAKSRRFDPVELLRMAQMHYEIEKNGEE